MTVDQIAEVCHEANRAYCRTIGDNSQAPWEYAASWQRESQAAGVKYCIANPDAPPSANHQAWLENKRADGWNWGKVKNAEKKEHPCCVPYDELPEEQKAKDRLVKAIVAALTSLTADEKHAQAARRSIC